MGNIVVSKDKPPMNSKRLGLAWLGTVYCIAVNSVFRKERSKTQAKLGKSAANVALPLLFNED